MKRLLCLLLPHQPIAPATRANSLRFTCSRCGDVVPGAMAARPYRARLPLTVVSAPVRKDLR